MQKNSIYMDKVQKEVTYINRLKVVLAEKHLTNKWLAENFVDTKIYG